MLPIHNRSTTFYENFYVARNKLQVYSNFNVTGQYNFTVSPSLLGHAIRNLLLKNPVFTVNYFKGDKSESASEVFDYTVSPVSTIAFNDVVEYVVLDHPFNGENLQQLNARTFELSVDKPLWKLVVYEFNHKQSLAFVCDHVIFDGNGACSFHADLLQELSKLHDDKLNLPPLEIVFDYENDKHLLDALPATTDKLASIFSPYFFFTNWDIWVELLPQFITNFVWKYVYGIDFYNYSIFSHKKIDPTKKIYHRIINLSSEQATTIMTSLRSKKLTFTPYLLAVISQLFQAKVFPYISDQAKIISANIVVDGRRYYPHLRQQLKYNFCVTSARILIPPLLTLSGMITYATESVQRAVASRNAFQIVGMLMFINPWDFIRGRFGKTDSRPTLEISNLGSKNLKSADGALQITDLIFSQDLGLADHFTFSVVGTPSGGINIVLCNNEDTEELKNAKSYQKVLDEFMQCLEVSLIDSIDQL